MKNLEIGIKLTVNVKTLKAWIWSGSSRRDLNTKHQEYKKTLNALVATCAYKDYGKLVILEPKTAEEILLLTKLYYL